MFKYGLSCFFLFIVNIEICSYWCEVVSVGCFLFEFVKGINQKLEVLQGKFYLLLNESFFCLKCLGVLEKGVECLNKIEDVKFLNIINIGRNMENQCFVMGSQNLRKFCKYKGGVVKVDVKLNKWLKYGEELEIVNENEEEGMLF